MIVTRICFIPIYARFFGRHDIGQGNVNILQHLQSDHRSGASPQPFLNLLIQFYSNNLTSLPMNFAQYRQHALRHGDRIVTIDYPDVTPPYVFGRTAQENV